MKDFDALSRHIVFARDELKLCGNCCNKRKNTAFMHSNITTACLTCNKPDVVSDKMIAAWANNPAVFMQKFKAIQA
jgi:hypothetical protein